MKITAIRSDAIYRKMLAASDEERENLFRYACGYHLVRRYLEKTGQSVFAATVANTEKILKEAEDFWV